MKKKFKLKLKLKVNEISKKYKYVNKFIVEIQDASFHLKERILGAQVENNFVKC